jgi:hypothetical protein
VALEILSGLAGGTAGVAGPKAKVKSQLSRVPVSDFRDWAVEAGWCGDVQSATVGDNDWWTFTKRLLQAAVDGAVTFWGRRYLYDYDQELDDEPLLKIPRAHFEDFGFDMTQMAQADNYNIFTYRFGDPPSAWKGTIFRDLHVDAEEAREASHWHGSPPTGRAG